MNGFQLVNYARFLTDTYGDTKWNDVTIIDYINECIRNINSDLAIKRSSILTKKVSFSTVANQQTYQLNSSGIITDNDFYMPERLVSLNATTGVGATYDLALNPEIVEVPAGEHHDHEYPYYYIYNNYIYIYPTPTSVVSLDFWYFKKLSTITLGDTPTWLDTNFHPLLSYYAAVRITFQDGKNTDMIRAEFKERYNEFMSFVFGSRQNSISYIPAGETWGY